jgi:hypothetical protein
VEENDVASRCAIEEGDEIIDFNFFSGGVVVGVVLEGESTAFNDIFVVGPGGIRQEYVCWRYFLLEELKADSECACAGEGLGGGYSSFLEEGGVLAEDEFLAAGDESWYAVNGYVFLNKGRGTILRVLSAISCSYTFLTMENTTGLRLSSR